MLEQDRFPMVSILIPTYNRPEYFEQALQSAISQTYQNKEIIIADDSTNDKTEKVVQQYLANYSFIHYVKNPRNLGPLENDLQLLELAKGDYINFLMDDDLFHHKKLEKMVPFLADEHVKLVTSHRQEIDEDSNLLPLSYLTQKLFDKNMLLEGRKMAESAIVSQYNYIGEPTTVLFRKKDLVEPFGVLNGRRYGCNVDLATWYGLLRQGKGVYIEETLSYLRRHKEQQSNKLYMHIKGLCDNAHALLVAPSLNLASSSDVEYLVGIERCLHHTFISIRQFIIDEDFILNHDDTKELVDFTYRLLSLKENIIDEMNNYPKLYL